MISITYGSILAVYFQGQTNEIIKGEKWYSDALDFCRTIAGNYDLPLSSVAGIVAALSPNNKWERNLADAENLISAYVSGGLDHASSVKVSTYNGNKIKALSILSGGEPLNILGGLKVRAFYGCIMGENSVCIDGHAYAIWRGEHILTTKTPKISTKLYSAITADYIKATDTINAITGNHYLPCQIQAITWIVWHRITKFQED